MTFLHTVLLVFCFAVLAFAENPHYDIAATYQDETHQVEGEQTITFVNTGPSLVSEVYLFLYPNLYRKKHPGLDVSFYRKAYPVVFNPGGIDILSIQDTDGAALSFFPDFYQHSIIIKVKLNHPVQPLEKFKFSVRFVTQIPQKWGPFSYYEDLAALQGGWHPYLANFSNGEWDFHDIPQESDYKIRMKLKKGLHLIGSIPPVLESVTGEDDTFLMEGEALSFFSLSIGRDFIEYETRVGQVEVHYHALSKDKPYAEQTIKLTEAAVQFYIKRYGLFPPTHIQLASAGLYQDLTAPGTNMLYISNRLFKVFPVLKRFHEASLAYGIYRLLWREKRPSEAWWVIEGLAKLDAEAFMQDRHGKIFNLEEWLKPISFIPLIDQILYSQTLPLRQVYFRESVPPVVSEDVRFFNNPPSENPSIFWKLRNLLGDDIMDRILSNYYAADQSAASFRAVIAETTGSDLNWLIDRWLTARLELDFDLLEVKKRKVAGVHETSIQIKKNGEGIEPLQIRVEEANGSRIPLVWDSMGETHRFELRTPSEVKSVELDPNKLSNDPNRLNNRLPRKWKVLLDRFNLNYDFQTRFLSYSTGLLFQRVYDTENWIRLLFSHAESGEVAHLGYSHALKKNHVLTTAVTHETINSDLDIAPREDGSSRLRGEDAGFVTLAYSYVFSEAPFLPESVQRLTTTFPSFSAGLTYNQQFTSNTYDNALLLRFDLRRIISFSNYHEIGGRVFIGQSVGNLFENSRFYLGGSDGIRGYTPLVFEGENMALYSVEYRFPLFYETDLNFIGLAYTHTWQAVLFSDTGMVGDSHNVFKFDQYESDVGVGLRIFVDLFGVYPAILRADAALPIASPREDEQKIHYYLNFGQSF